MTTMTFDHTRLIIAAFERTFYLSIIFVVLWVNGFLWTVLSIASFFLLATLFFSRPIIVDVTNDESDLEEASSKNP